MKTQDILTSKEIENIEVYLEERTESAEKFLEAAWSDEDTVTGHFLGRLCAEKTIGNLIIKIGYFKYPGRGKDALEKLTGADGIITLEINDKKNELKKGILFQSKKDGSKQNLSDQIEKLGIFENKSSVIIDYSSYGNEILVNEIENSRMTNKSYKFNHLMSKFIKCEYGIIGMSYNHRDKSMLYNQKTYKSRKDFRQLEIQISKQT